MLFEPSIFTTGGNMIPYAFIHHSKTKVWIGSNALFLDAIGTLRKGMLHFLKNKNLWTVDHILEKKHFISGGLVSWKKSYPSSLPEILGESRKRWRFFLTNSCLIFSCDQAALQMVFSVRLSVCPSVCHTFLTMFPSSYHHEIFRSYY